MKKSELRQMIREELLSEDMKSSGVAQAKKDLKKLHGIEKKLDEVLAESKYYSPSTEKLLKKALAELVKARLHLEKDLK